MAIITEAILRARLASGIPNPFSCEEGDKLTPAAADFLRARGITIQKGSSGPTPIHHMNTSESKHIPVGVSNRHVHLSPEHVEKLFGTGHILTPLRELSQKGQFAARETVTLAGPKGIIQNVRVLGPSRGATQVEISRTDGYTLGIHPPVRLSGNLHGTPGITIVGEKTAIVLNEGLIVAKNHVHLSPADAKTFGVMNGDSIIVQTLGDRPLLFADVTVRVNDGYSMDFHVDMDEANAASLRTGDFVRMVGKASKGSGAAKGE